MVSNILLWTFGGWEILLVVLVILIFFGAKRIPELAKGLGKGIREFKNATKAEKIKEKDEEDAEEEEAKRIDTDN
jgi:sec-independent protein translocase protein TatA